jgi:hypothetical protein
MSSGAKFLLPLCLIAVCAQPAFAADVKPLTAAESQTFWGSPEDAVPEVRHAFKKENEGQHFLYCDELYLQLFEPELRALATLPGGGGGYVGVGTDQAYLFIGWMRPSFAWLTDYDPLVQVMHRVYAAFFAEAATPAEFLTLWRDRKKGMAALNAHAAKDAQLESLQKVYQQQQYYALRRLEYLAKPFAKSKYKSFVNDDEEYSFVRAMVAAKRVRPMLGNLLAEVGLKGVAAAARKLHVPIRGVYVSNAEQYWKYPDSFRANIAALPFDAKSFIIRTQAIKPVNKDYRYFLQAASLFVAQMADPKVKQVYDVSPAVNVIDPTTAPLVILAADGTRTVRWTHPPVKPLAVPGTDPLVPGQPVVKP